MLLRLNSKRQEPAPPTDGLIQFHAGDTMFSAVVQVASKWDCPIDEASRRIMNMALSGWKLKYAGYLTALSEFCADRGQPFQTTCITMRNWLVMHEQGMEEDLSDLDLQARFEMILDALQEKKKHGEKADLATILAEDDVDSY